MLEKRVRSRFLQEQITVEYCTKLDQLLAIMKQMIVPNVSASLTNTQHISVPQPQFLSQFTSRVNVHHSSSSFFSFLFFIFFFQ
jgi:hypothetical protein